LAARVVRRADAGIVVDPGDAGSFIRAAHQLIEDDQLRRRLSANARRYAEAHFRIGPIADAFEKVICEAAGESMVSNVGALANDSHIIAARSEV
jgi:glycosyltransferase involved in cell wall biosynthesis